MSPSSGWSGGCRAVYDPRRPGNTGTVNAVNITDGVDGLAGTVTLPVSAFFAAAFAYGALQWQRPGSAAMSVFAAALFGGIVGFLV